MRLLPKYTTVCLCGQELLNDEIRWGTLLLHLLEFLQTRSGFIQGVTLFIC